MKNKNYVSGSNADLLSKKLVTKLTGRQVIYEVSLFSYNEFLIHTELKGELTLFKKFLFSGGFPEYVSTAKLNIFINLYYDILS